MAYFPFFIEIENQICLIVGGGEVAYRKAKAILDFGAHVRVVAPHVCEKLKKLAECQAQIHIMNREFLAGDLKDALFVIAATNNRAVNDSVWKLCREKRILINVVDEKEQCSFYFPSLVKQKDMVIGISSGGKSPVLSQTIRKEVENIIPEYYGELNEYLGEMREYVQKTYDTMDERKAFFEKIIQTYKKENEI